jgi:hypothetical protein
MNKSILSLFLLLFINSSFASQKLFMLDTVQCYDQDKKLPVEIWSTKETNPESRVVLKLSGLNNLTLSASSALCEGIEFQYKIYPALGSPMKLKFDSMDESLYSCFIELNFYNGPIIDPAKKYTFDFMPMKELLKKLQEVEVSSAGRVLKIGLPVNAKGSQDEGCAGSCKCDFVFQRYPNLDTSKNKRL